MDLWSGVVRVPLAVKNRKIIGSEITTVTITTFRKKDPREWYVYHFQRRV